MLEVLVKSNEKLESALRKFKRLVEKRGVPREYRERQGYRKPSERKRKKSKEASKRRKRTVRTIRR